MYLISCGKVVVKVFASTHMRPNPGSAHFVMNITRLPFQLITALLSIWNSLPLSVSLVLSMWTNTLI